MSRDITVYHGNSWIYNLKAGNVDEKLAFKHIITQLNSVLSLFT